MLGEQQQTLWGQRTKQIGGFDSMNRNTLRDWSEYMAATGASAATIRTRTGGIAALTRHAGLDDPLQLTRRDTLSFLARPQKQWTKVTYWRSIRAWVTWLTEFDYPHDDLLKGLPKPRIPSAIARPIDTATIHTLLASNMTKRTRAYVMLALYCGLRVHEIAKLRGEDFDLESGWLTVNGKGGITKPIPVHPEIIKLAGTMPEVGDWFPSRTYSDGHVGSLAVSLTITNALRSVGSMATAHQLRDTAATDFQRRVKDVRLTQAFLRHQSLQSTMKYTEVSNAAFQAAVNATNWAA